MQWTNNRRHRHAFVPHIAKTAKQYLTEIYPPRQLPERWLW